MTCNTARLSREPPYNTGARDWKYDNDYVDGEDAYRHSKWLAFMERRLLLAKELLNPDDSVLIVTIDEKEYLRLGLLLEQTFPDARRQMVSSVINPKGAARSAAFGRTDEYLFMVMNGEASPAQVQLGAEWKVVEDKRAQRLRWAELLRSGSNTARAVSQIRFFPVFVQQTDDGPVIHSVGEPHVGDGWESLASPEGTAAVWPIRKDGSEGVWQISREALIALMDEGFVHLGQWRGSDTTVYYLKAGEAKKVRDGTIPVVGQRTDGSIITDVSEYAAAFVPGTQWRISSHNAEQGGTNLLKSLLPRRKFPFPKSLYAVEDTIRFFVKDKPDAVILDFFSGSGTTAHAVARLNKQDAGRRQSISVTNNEVSAAEARALAATGNRDGDPEWEVLGIFEHITRPRITAAITGRTPEGEPIKGDYKFTDEFPMADGFEENVEFFELTYEDVQQVDADRAFEAIAPLLWLRAGGHGPILYETRDPAGRRLPYAIGERYAVLFNADRWRTFVAKLPDGVSVVFVVSDSSSTFTTVSKELPPEVVAVRLYRNYLSTFEIGRAWVEGTVR